MAEPAQPGDVIPRHVVRAFAETARYIYASEDLDETLGRVTAAAVELVPGCDLASTSIIERNGFVTLAATDDRAVAGDQAQYDCNEGPCLSAIRDIDIVYTPDVAADPRWPRLAGALAGQDVTSVLSCRLSVHDAAQPAAMGGLNLYGLRMAAFDDGDVDLALLLSAHAGVVLHAAQQAGNLRQALESRDAIGQAKGVLMERERITADQAFDRLRTMSQRMNVKLRWLAEHVVLTGEVDPSLASSDGDPVS
jgi:GAF domain-containing protein